MKLITIKLLIGSLILIGLTIVAAILWGILGMGSKASTLLTIPLILSIGFNIAGIIFGVIELKKNQQIATLSMAGHFLLLLLVIIFAMYAVISTPI